MNSRWRKLHNHYLLLFISGYPLIYLLTKSRYNKIFYIIISFAKLNLTTGFGKNLRQTFLLGTFCIFLKDNTTTKHQLQLIGVAAYLVACKYEETTEALLGLLNTVAGVPRSRQ